MNRSAFAGLSVSAIAAGLAAWLGVQRILVHIAQLPGAQFLGFGVGSSKDVILGLVVGVLVAVSVWSFGYFLIESLAQLRDTVAREMRASLRK